MQRLPRHLDLFRSLADPLGPDIALSAEEAAAQVDLAIHHRLAPILARRLARAGHRQERLQEETETVTVLTLRLEPLAADLAHRFAEAGIRWRLVKGLDFAQALFPQVPDRPFTDLDVLVPPEDLEAAAAPLRALGFEMHGSAERAARLAEQKWLHRTEPSLLIELHTDLVHYPQLRRRVSLSYGVLEHPDLTDPLRRMLIAVAHGLLGHKLHEYRMVIDLLQAYRALSDAEQARLPGAARAVGLGYETDLALALLSVLYGTPHAAHRGFGARLLGPYQVLDPSRGANARLRRHAVRALQTLVRR